MVVTASSIRERLIRHALRHRNPTKTLPRRPRDPPPSSSILHHIAAGDLRASITVLRATPSSFPASVYSRLLHLCASRRALVAARCVESHIISSSFPSPPSTFLLNRAIETYALCGSISDARELFDEMPHRTGGTWNAMISAYASAGCPSDAIALFVRMNVSGIRPKDVTFASVLRSCSSLLALTLARQVHGLILKFGFCVNVILGTSLVDVYGKCQIMDEAHKQFDEIPDPNPVSWNVIVRRYLDFGQAEKALCMFLRMIHVGVIPLNFTVSSALVACSDSSWLSVGCQIHGIVVKNGYETDYIVENSIMELYANNALLDMYTKCGNLKSADLWFLQMGSRRDKVSWNSLLAGYARHGRSEEAFDIFIEMLKETAPNEFTFSLMLAASANIFMLEHGKQIHACLIRNGFNIDVIIRGALVDMYCKCRLLDYAVRVFEKESSRDVVLWNSAILGFAYNGRGAYSIELFEAMQRDGIRPDNITFIGALSACAGLVDSGSGVQIHALISKSPFAYDVYMGSALVDMYSKCRRAFEAHRVFDNMPEKNVVSWNSLITCYEQNGPVSESLDMFVRMMECDVEYDEVTLASVVSACASLLCIREGMQIHAQAIKFEKLRNDLILCNALVDMYAKCGKVSVARKIFDGMMNIVAWNALIAGYTQNGENEEALRLFLMLKRESVWPSHYTFGNVLNACANLAELQLGQQAHAHVMKHGFRFQNGPEPDIFVGNSLLDMYHKCGSIDESRKVFERMLNRDRVSWNAMIVGYAQNGSGLEAINLYKRMLMSEEEPDNVTMIGVLSGCSHAGLVEEGRKYFDSMFKEHGLIPSRDHYTCMIDLLGRAGQFGEVEKFIREMPIEPDSVFWSSLLSACRVHHNVQMGEWVAGRLFELDSENSGPYILLSNMYAEVGRWADVVRIRKLMKDKGVIKQPGCSWVEIGRKIHVFMVKDKTHPKRKEIYRILRVLKMQMERLGAKLNAEVSPDILLLGAE
ncbi:Pentatricopeptide repeat-containing protein [Dendrobium catenatum]|uniref:Pentatricopeptide repeat-containing protein n=1 Tax=Dendrobium catenatum TaxID=906689 RepID=A0A2I0VA10_9ASPA|nr:Pentatricopeptide repeat-containing protein [Dendrobium catenatum]